MAAEQESLILKFSAQFDNWKSGFQDASNSYTGFLNNLGGGKTIMLGLAAGAAAAGAAAFGLAKSVATTGDDIGTMAEQAGVAVKDFSLLKYAAEQSDTNIKTLSTGFINLSRVMLDAQDPGSKAADLFDAIGVSTKNVDGSLRPMKDVLLDVAGRFKEIEDPTLKSALAMEVFGKSGTEMLPFLNQGAEGIEALMGEGEKLGAAWDELSTGQADEFGKALVRLQVAAGSLGKEIGVALIPWFTKLMNFLAEVARPTIGAIKAVFLLLAADATTLASGLAAVYLGATKVSDALGITENASQGAREVFDAMTASAEDLRKRAGETFEVMVTGSTKAKDETKNLRTAQEALTDAQKKNLTQIGIKEKAEKEAAKATKERAKAQEEAGKKILEMAQLEMKASEQIEARRKREQEAIGRAILETAQLERRVMEENARLHGMAQEAMGREIQTRAKKEQEALQQSRDNWNAWFNLTADLTGTFRQFSFETFDFVKQSFGDAVGQMAVRGGDLKEKLDEIWKRILEAFISMLFQMGVEYVAQHAIMQAFAAANPIIQPVVTAPVGGPGGVPGAPGAAGAGGMSALQIGGALAGGAATVDAANRARTGDNGDIATAFVESPIGAQVGLVMRVGDSIFGGGGESDNTRLARHYGRDRVAMRAAKRMVDAQLGEGSWDRMSYTEKANAMKELIRFIGLEVGDPDLYNLTSSERRALSDMVAARGLWAGGIVTKPMLAKIAEGGESEVVAPLSRLREMLGGFGGGGNINISVSLPNIRKITDFTDHEAEQVLKTTFNRASRNLSRRGYTWGMQPGAR